MQRGAKVLFLYLKKMKIKKLKDWKTIDKFFLYELQNEIQ